MELVWSLKKDPEELGRLMPRRNLSAVLGVTGIVGPPVGTDDWWQGIDASSQPIVSKIAEVDLRGGTFRLDCDADSDRAFRTLGDPLDNIPGFEVRVNASFPPPGFTADTGVVGAPGVVTEIWMSE